ncbi:MAG: PQQ-binding-like beta-propeller repeat protein [Terracidiphilus sp.]|jgi:outer membrane protein assembly factor BamB
MKLSVLRDAIVNFMNRFGVISAFFLFAAISAAQGIQSGFRGGPDHLGVYSARPPKQLTLKWAFTTSGAIVSSPTVAAGVVYVGSADGNLYALDSATGKLRWSFDAHGDVNSSPAVADGTVYVVSQDGNLYAVDSASGKQRWSFATLGEHRFTAMGILGAHPSTEMMPDPWDFFLSSPAVAEGAVYFGSGDGHIYCVDAHTGALRWNFKTGDVVHSSPTVAGGMVYVGSWDTYFYALNAATGTLAWKFQTGEDPKAHLMTGIPGSAAVSNGMVFWGCRDANFYALDTRTGALKWKVPNDGSWVISSPAVANGVVYYTTSDSHRFQALDAVTGKILYWLPTNVYSFSSPAIAGLRAYFGTFDGQLHAVDLDKRAYAGGFATPGYTANGPRYLAADGGLKADGIWTGDTLDDMIIGVRGKIFSMGSILSSPAVGDGAVYFGSVDGKLYALGD